MTELLSRASREVLSLVRAAAFWLAALLPLSYVPLLGGASITFAGFTKLLLLNVLAVLIGHGYGSDDSDGDGSDHAHDDGTEDSYSDGREEVAAAD